MRQYSIYDNFGDVKAFHEKMDLPRSEVPIILSDVEMRKRIDFMLEELMEIQGCSNVALVPNLPDDMKLKTMAAIFDGLIDLVYVAMGTAVMMGLPWQRGWRAVQTANMEKVRDLTQDTEHHRGVVKPPGWTPPDLLRVLEKEYE